MGEINQVRQILMNELGLTRDSIRTMATEIIEGVVAKHVKHLLDNGKIGEMVAATIKDIAREGYYDHDSIRSLVLVVAREQLEKFIKDRLIIKSVE